MQRAFGTLDKREDENLKTLLDDLCQIFQELVNFFNVDLSTINKRLTAMGIIIKQGN